MNLLNYLRSEGIKVSIIKHDLYKPAGRFDPMDYKPQGINNNGCYIVKMSYPAIEGNCGYNTKEEMDGTKPTRYKGDKWVHSVTDFDVEFGEAMIEVKGVCYPEEVLWWFMFGSKPSIEEALRTILSDFNFLEEYFWSSLYHTIHFDPHQSEDIFTLLEALEEMDGRVMSWDKRRQCIDVWYRIKKLYDRMYDGLGFMYTQSNTGLGKRIMNNIKELLND